jgi:(S)-3,5-dihydroxyphenylglycine transaminase
MTSHLSAPDSAHMELAELSGELYDPLLDSMNFLNEITARFPDAVSFAPGRPSENFFASADLNRHLVRYREFLATERGYGEADIARTLFQYGRTKGIIHEEIARYLATDEHIDIDPESIVVTVGAQEAMYLTLRALRRDERDVALAVTPTYVGFTGAARLAGMPVVPVASGPLGVDLADLREQTRSARECGLRPRCLYIVPDFANPTGVSLDVRLRAELLACAENENILLLEDNPYGSFTGHRDPLPTLKSLDAGHRVVYIGSFAKTVLPGVRVGFAVADQSVTAPGRQAGYLADELAKLKSMVTVNTPSVSQAIVAGRLLENEFSLARANRDLVTLYRRNMDLIIAGLRDRFDGVADVSWTTPAGGFFVVLSVGFRADDTLLEHSAREHRVLWTPMDHFYAGADGDHQLRLSCSSLTPQEIQTGLDGLAKLVAEQSTPAAR